MPFFIGLLLLPLVEIWLLVEIGGEIGGWTVVAWVVVSALVGGWLLRSQGDRALARIQEAMAHGEDGVVAAELLDGLAVLMAGICLVLPGFLTDSIGILLFIPGLRRAVGRWVWGWAKDSDRVRVYAARRSGTGRGAPVIEGEYRDLSEDSERRGGGNEPPRLH